mmetsp:Transcript_7555/g.16440  ORF Transcript_7555/g.16440 Transcript_7555/m.16440 type:complete len:543 (-) Transcript_7555:288-1916(-)
MTNTKSTNCTSSSRPSRSRRRSPPRGRRSSRALLLDNNAMNMNHHGHASSAHEEEMDLNRSIMKLTLKDNTSSETTTLKEEESSLAETVSVSSTSYCSSCHGHDINSSVHSCHSCQCSISSYITPVVHEEEDDDDDDDETHHGIHHNHRDIPHRDILPNDIPHNDILDHPLCPVTGRHTSVLSHYVLFPKLLGEGNYGTVRECIHRSSWRTYAIKTIDKSKILRLDHLQNEIRLLKSIDHEGILNMVDYYEDADYVHIITEKYSGGDLFDRIVERTDPAAGCYSEDGAAGMMARLLEAVAYLHERNIVHRDIKPENILFASSANDDRPTLIDFGLSRRHDSMREPLMTNPVGTSYYMSPELLAGSYDRSCDLWAVGIIAYILLCGYPPFNGPTDNDVYEAIGVGNLEFREKHWNNKSRDAMDFVLALLKRDPKERMTAEEALAHPWIVRGCGCGGGRAGSVAAAARSGNNGRNNGTRRSTVCVSREEEDQDGRRRRTTSRQARSVSRTVQDRRRRQTISVSRAVQDRRRRVQKNGLRYLRIP